MNSHKRFKRWTKDFAYTLGVPLSYPGYKHSTFTIDRTKYQNTAIAYFSNGALAGGGLLLGKDADVSDGELNLTMLTAKEGILGLFRIIYTLLRAKLHHASLFNSDSIKTQSGIREMTCYNESGISKQLNLDGEVHTYDQPFTKVEFYHRGTIPVQVP